MIIHEVTEECFKKYGKVIDSIDLTELVSTMQTVEIPADVVYEPSISALEKLKCATELQQKTYGELPIQIGWCIGNNHKLNAVEYHRCSEVNIAATDAILILGRQQDVSAENTYDTSLMEAFRIPSGTAVELYATTLHFRKAQMKPWNIHTPAEKMLFLQLKTNGLSDILKVDFLRDHT